MDELWDIARVAAYLGVTERTVYNKVRAGDLPAVKVGRLWRVRESDLQEWLASGSLKTGDNALIAEPGVVPTRDALEDLLASVGDTLERRLTFVAVLSAGVEALGWPAPVVVGGHAVEFYTAGSYATIDIDLAGASEPVDMVLRGWGFEREGRHWFDEALGLVVEVPGSRLGPDELAHAAHARVGRFVVGIIGIEDLVIDRLAACKHWDDQDSCDWADTLLAGGHEIDLGYLRRRAVEEDVLDKLQLVLPEGAE